MLRGVAGCLFFTVCLHLINSGLYKQPNIYLPILFCFLYRLWADAAYIDEFELKVVAWFAAKERRRNLTEMDEFDRKSNK